MKRKIDLKEICDAGVEVSDGYHTFSELYKHRISLFIALCKVCQGWIDTEGEFGLCGRKPWKSKKHSDGTSLKGWFVMGIGEEKGRQITYHIPLERWSEVSFAKTLKKAPEYDGHTSEDVLKRLNNL